VAKKRIGACPKSVMDFASVAARFIQCWFIFAHVSKMSFWVSATTLNCFSASFANSTGCMIFSAVLLPARRRASDGPDPLWGQGGPGTEAGTGSRNVRGRQHSPVT